MAATHTFFWKLDQLINQFGHLSGRRKQPGTRIGNPSRSKRGQLLRQAFHQLFDLGFRPKAPQNFKEKHVKALISFWVSEGISPSEIQSRLSALRNLCRWIGKQGMIKSAEKYVDDPRLVRRKTTAQSDKTWNGNQVNAFQKIREIWETDRYIAIQLLLEKEFGLRAQEAMLLRPHFNDQGYVLRVERGTKGGLVRAVNIETTNQRIALRLAKALTKEGESMIPGDFTLKRWRDRYYRVLRRHKIGRNFKVVGHGLRHQYINEGFRKLTGVYMSIKKGDTSKLDMSVDTAAREHCAKMVGHSRADVISCYGGPKGRGRKHNKTE